MIAATLAKLEPLQTARSMSRTPSPPARFETNHIAGCGGVEGQRPDAGYGDAGYKQSDASVPDASAICDPTGTFEAPVHLAEFDTVDVPGPPRLTADELELYFTEHIGTADADLYRAQRSATDQPFGTPIALTQVNSTVADDNPSVTSDGLTLFFESTRLSGSVAKLFVSTRPSRVGEFGAPSEVANVNSTTVTDNDAQPFVTADGQELIHTSIVVRVSILPPSSRLLDEIRALRYIVVCLGIEGCRFDKNSKCSERFVRMSGIE